MAVSRRSFFGAVGAALAVVAAPKVFAPVVRRKPQFRQVHVAQVIPAELSIDEMDARYIRPAIECLVDRIDREAVAAYCKLPDVRGVAECRQMKIRERIPVRLLTHYDCILEERVMRVDCGFYS